MIRKYLKHKLLTTQIQMTVLWVPPHHEGIECYEKCIPPQHGKIYFIYIGLAQVISKAFINNPYQNMQMY